MSLTKTSEKTFSSVAGKGRKIEYEGGYGYIFQVTKIGNMVSTKFIPLRAVMQPDILYNHNTGDCLMNFDRGNLPIDQVPEFIKNVEDAKELIQYINANRESLIP